MRKQHFFSRKTVAKEAATIAYLLIWI